MSFSASLIKLCKDLHALMATLEEELYDWNMKVRKQEGEVSNHGNSGIAMGNIYTGFLCFNIN